MSESSASVWTRWGLGIVGTVLFTAHVTLLGFILNGVLNINVVDERTRANQARIEKVEDAQQSMLEAISGLRVEIAKLTEALRIANAAKE